MSNDSIEKASEDVCSNLTSVRLVHGGVHSPVVVSLDTRHVGANKASVSPYEFYTVERLTARQAEDIALAILGVVSDR